MCTSMASIFFSPLLRYSFLSPLTLPAIDEAGGAKYYELLRLIFGYGL